MMYECENCQCSYDIDCDIKYKNKFPYKRFCSVNCYYRYKKLHKKQEGYRKCEYCGKEFYWDYNSIELYGKQGNQIDASRYCCYECGTAARREKTQKSWTPEKKRQANQHREETFLKHYSSRYAIQTAEVRQKLSNTFQSKDKEFWDRRNDKSKETLLKEYGVENGSQIPGVQEKTHSKEVIEKQLATKRRNNSFNKSRDEEILYEMLIKKFKECKRNYRSSEYPFNCDFYVPKLNLYIEYQGHWTHGKDGVHLVGPYKKRKKHCIDLLLKWKSKNNKFYNKAIEVWTVHDPLKRETAKNNGLNWLEFFTMNEFMNWYNKQ